MIYATRFTPGVWPFAQSISLREGEELPAGFVVSTPQEVASFLAEQNALHPGAQAALPPPAPPVPAEVTRRQFFRAAHAVNPSLTKDALRAQLPDYASQVDFDDALTFKRTHPLINAMAAQLGFTSEDLDNLFRLAATFE